MKIFKLSFSIVPVFINAVVAAAALMAGSASAQLVGYDDASKYVLTANWTNGANQGFGFTPWAILTNETPGGFQGWYINTGTAYADAIVTNVSGTNYTCVWGLFANGTNAINQTTAFRGFSNTLGTNTFKIQWGAREAGSTTVVNTGAVNGWCGFTLRSGNTATTPSDFETGARLYVYFLNGNSPSTLYVWDNNGVQSLPGTSFSNLGRDTITNAVEAEVTPAADGMSYHMVLKDVVANQTLCIFDGVFMGGVGTEDSAALFDYETQSPGDQVFNRMQIAVPQIPPEINNVMPTNASIFLPAATQLTFEVDSFNSTVASSAVSVYLNGVLQTGSTFNTASPTSQLLGTNNPVLAPNTFYTYTIVATDANNNSTTNTVTFNTFSPNNTCIQAEDYNYNSGQYFGSPTPLEYAGLLGSNTIDYLDLDTNNLNNYRVDSNPNDPLQPQLLPSTDTADHDMFVEDNISDYQLGYTDAGSWENYTRTFPGTRFNIYARAASAGGGSFLINLLANSTATTTNQPLAALGTCYVAATGGSTVYSGQLTPMTDVFGNTVALNLSGINTLQQAALSNRGYNLYYLMLVPNSGTGVLAPYLSIAAPLPNATGVGLATPITFTIANRQTTVATNTILLYVNTTNVTSKLHITTNAAGISVSYTPSTNLPANSLNSMAVVFNDKTGTNLSSNYWTFVTGNTGGTSANAIWSGAGAPMLNWSAATNWTGGTPGPTFSATFASPGSTTNLATNNIVDTSFNIGELCYATNTNGFHTTYIANGVTLTVSNSSTANGYEAFQVGGYATGGTTTDNVFNQKVTNTITGSGGTLQVLGNAEGSGLANALNFQVRQCASPAAPEQTVMDMSGLGNLIVTVGKLTVGQGGSGASQSNCSARLNLAMTNTITLLRSTSPQFVVGDSSGGPNTLPGSTVNLGMTNSLFLDSIGIGKQKATNALLRFNPAFTNGFGTPGVLIRDTNGLASRVTSWNIGDVLTESTVPAFNSGTVDLSGGTVDALIGTMNVGRGGTNKNDTGTAQGTLTLTAGVLNVTNLLIGVEQTNNSASVTGIVNVNGTASLVSTNGGITLAKVIAGGSGTTSGTLNITDGSVLATITAGGGTSAVNLASGTLTVPVGGSIGTSAAPITALTLSGGALHLNVNGSAPAAIINASSVTASSTTITIDSVANVTGATTVHLISYTGANPYSGLSLDGVPYGYAATLVNNSGSVDLTMTVASLPPSPKIGSISISSGHLILSGNNNTDVADGSYSILTSTNVAAPLTNWTLLNRGYFDASGNFSSTNPMGTNNQQFYILRLP